MLKAYLIMVLEHEEIRIDPFASVLKRGERPDCSGLLLLVAWRWGADPSTKYEILANQMRSLDPGSLLVYDLECLHCTVATLSRRVLSNENFEYILYCSML